METMVEKRSLVKFPHVVQAAEKFLWRLLLTDSLDYLFNHKD
jgi:hypothetical protein